MMFGADLCEPAVLAAPSHPAFQREGRAGPADRATAAVLANPHAGALAQRRLAAACAPFVRFYGTANARRAAVVDEDNAPTDVVADARALAAVHHPVRESPAWAVVAAAADGVAARHAGAGWTTTVTLAAELCAVANTDADARANAAAMRRLPTVAASVGDDALCACSLSLSDVWRAASPKAREVARSIAIRAAALIGMDSDNSGNADAIALSIAGLCRGSAEACALVGVSWLDVVALCVAAFRTIRAERLRQTKFVRHIEAFAPPPPAPVATQHLRIAACFADEAKRALGVAKDQCAALIARATLLDVRDTDAAIPRSAPDDRRDGAWRVLAIDGDLLVHTLAETKNPSTVVVDATSDRTLPPSSADRAADIAAATSQRLCALGVRGLVISGTADDIIFEALRSVDVCIAQGVGFRAALDVAVVCGCGGLASADDIIDPDVLTDDELVWYTGMGAPWRVVPFGYYEEEDAPTRRTHHERTRTYTERRVVLIRGETPTDPLAEDTCSEVIPCALILFARSEPQVHIFRAIVLRALRRCLASLDWEADGAWDSFAALPAVGVADHVIAASASDARKAAVKRLLTRDDGAQAPDTLDSMALNALASASYALPILAACNRLRSHASGAHEAAVQAAAHGRAVEDALRHLSSDKSVLVAISMQAASAAWHDEAPFAMIPPLDTLASKRDALRAACHCSALIQGADLAITNGVK